MLHSVVTTHIPNLASSYLAELHGITLWAERDRERMQRCLPDTQEHLLECLRLLDNISRVSGEQIGVHDSQIANMRTILDDSEGISHARLAEELLDSGFLEWRRQRYAGTSTCLAQMFDKICERMSGLHQKGGRC